MQITKVNSLLAASPALARSIARDRTKEKRKPARVLNKKKRLKADVTAHYTSTVINIIKFSPSIVSEPRISVTYQLTKSPCESNKKHLRLILDLLDLPRYCLY